ncbi:MAG: hypothetical protein OXI36_08340 [Gammaproteobacteria bacterium]|nr:hypothetical protein [Gammaproteobacteria bacterium]
MKDQSTLLRIGIYVGILVVAVVLVIYFTGGNRAQQLNIGAHTGLLIACELEPTKDVSEEEGEIDDTNTTDDQYRCTASIPNTKKSYTLNISNEEAIFTNLTYIACQFQKKVLLADITVTENEPDFVNPESFRCIDEARLQLGE